MTKNGLNSVFFCTLQEADIDCLEAYAVAQTHQGRLGLSRSVVSLYLACCAFHGFRMAAGAPAIKSHYSSKKGDGYKPAVSKIYLKKKLGTKLY